MIVQQLIYGSSPLVSEKGYHILGVSENVSLELQAASVEWFKQLGEYSHISVIKQALMSVSFSGNNNSLKLIAKISLVEEDSHGRKGTMISRAILVTHEEFKKYFADPFLYEEDLELSQIGDLIKAKILPPIEISVQKNKDSLLIIKQYIQGWDKQIFLTVLANFYDGQPIQLPNVAESLTLIRGLIFCTPIDKRSILNISTFSNLYTRGNDNPFHLSINPRLEKELFIEIFKKTKPSPESNRKAEYVLNLILNNQYDKYLAFVSTASSNKILVDDNQAKVKDKNNDGKHANELSRPNESLKTINVSNTTSTNTGLLCDNLSNANMLEEKELNYEIVSKRKFSTYYVLLPVTLLVLIVGGITLSVVLRYYHCTRIEERSTSSKTEIFLAYKDFLTSYPLFSRYTNAKEKFIHYEKLAEKENFDKIVKLNSDDCEKKQELLNLFLQLFPSRANDQPIKHMSKQINECLSLKKLIAQINESPFEFEFKLRAIQLFLKEYPDSAKRTKLLNLQQQIIEKLNCLEYEDLIQAVRDNDFNKAETLSRGLLNQTADLNIKKACVSYLAWWQNLTQTRTYKFRIDKEYRSSGVISEFRKLLRSPEAEKFLNNSRLLVKTDRDSSVIRFKNLETSRGYRGEISWKRGQPLDIILIDSKKTATKYIAGSNGQLSIFSLNETYKITSEVIIKFNLQDFQIFSNFDFECDKSPLPIIRVL